MNNRLCVNYVYTLRDGKHPAYWNINKDDGKITFRLGFIWDISQEEDSVTIMPKENDELDKFINDLIFYDLSERICIERAHEKILIKGGRCNPCCVWYFTQLAMYPFAWDIIKESQGRKSKL